MNAIGKVAGVLLGLLGILFLVTSLGMFALTFSRSTGSGYTALITALVGVGFMYWGWTAAGKPWSSRSRGRRITAMSRAAEEWMRMLDQMRQFPGVDVGGILLPRGETALLSEPSTLIEQTTRTSRVSGGTRVMLGHQPFYFGRSEPITKKILREAATGRLTLTDQALLFNGNARTVAVELAKLMSIEPYATDAIIVAVRGKAKPAIFVVANPMIWTLTVRMAAQVPMTGGRIPLEARFEYGPSAIASERGDRTSAAGG